MAGSIDGDIVGFGNINAPQQSDHLAYCTFEGDDARCAIERSTAAVILCRPQLVSLASAGSTRALLIGVVDPRREFVEACYRLFPAPSTQVDLREAAHIHQSAFVHPTACIGPYAVIGPDAYIGKGCVVGPHVSLIGPVKMGIGCIIEAGAVIGSDGFGYARSKDGTLKRFPHAGDIELCDGAVVGANVTIDRGALGRTTIGTGTMIDDGAYIAHNVAIGRDCLVMARAILCGSSRLGDGVEVSPGAIIREAVKVGDGARVGLGAVVVKDVSQGALVAGVPARPFPVQTN